VPELNGAIEVDTVRGAGARTNGQALRTSAARVVVVGLGYVGLPTALILARAGHDVLGCDIDPDVIASVADGRQSRVCEPEVATLLTDPGIAANMRAQSTPRPADVFIIAVPTPVDDRRKQADLGAVASAARSIMPHLGRGTW
jgi:UDP-N-acetyl-D-mannosaminuronic acid dehydrogenase